VFSVALASHAQAMNHGTNPFKVFFQVGFA
jgi:hypothetical protein